MTDHKRCEECEWYAELSWGVPFCGHAATSLDLHHERLEVDGNCGPGGKLWEKRHD